MQTGAGITTSAGIPDYRGPRGVWTQRAQGLEVDPKWDQMHSLRPTFCHRAIAALVAQGKVKHLITTNVDNLHQKSGVPEDMITEIHGNVFLEVHATLTHLGPPPRHRPSHNPPPPPKPPSPLKGASDQHLVGGGVVGVQNRGVASPMVVPQSGDFVPKPSVLLKNGYQVLSAPNFAIPNFRTSRPPPRGGILLSSQVVFGSPLPGLSRVLYSSTTPCTLLLTFIGEQDMT